MILADDFCGKNVTEMSYDGFFYLFYVRFPSAEFGFYGADAFASYAAWNDSGKITQVGIDVKSEAVHRHPARRPHTHGAYLRAAGVPASIHTPVSPSDLPALMPKSPVVRIIVSSRRRM